MRLWQQHRDEKTSPEIGDTDLASYNQAFASGLGSAPPCCNPSRDLYYLPQPNNSPGGRPPGFPRVLPGHQKPRSRFGWRGHSPQPCSWITVGQRKVLWNKYSRSSVPLCPLPQRKWVHKQRGEARRGRRKRRRAEVGPRAPRARPGCWTEGGDQRREVARASLRRRRVLLAAAEAAVAAATGGWKGGGLGRGGSAGEREGRSGGWEVGLAGGRARKCLQLPPASRGLQAAGRTQRGAIHSGAARGRPSPSLKPRAPSAEPRAPSERAQPPRSSPPRASGSRDSPRLEGSPRPAS